MVAKFYSRFYEEKEFFEIRRKGRNLFTISKNISGLSNSIYSEKGLKNIVIRETFSNRLPDDTNDKIRGLKIYLRAAIENLKIHEFVFKYEKIRRKIETHKKERLLKENEFMIVKLRNYNPFYREVSKVVSIDEIINLNKLIKKYEKIVIQSEKCKSVKLIKRKLPLILSSRASGIFIHEIIGHTLEADLVVENKSLFKPEDIDKKFFPSSFNVSDISLVEETDDEGEKKEEIVLVKDGVLKNFISSLYFKKFFSIGTSGRGRRSSYSYPPIPRQNTIYLKGGKRSFFDILSGVNEGILIKNVKSGNFNVKTKEFYLNIIEAYVIKNGMLDAQLKNFKIKGNLINYIEKMEDLSSETYFGGLEGYCHKKGQNIRTAYKVPSILFNDIELTVID